MKLTDYNPKKLSDKDLWAIIQNVFPEKAPKNVQKWYKKIEREFYKRNIKLVPICN